MRAQLSRVKGRRLPAAAERAEQWLDPKLALVRSTRALAWRDVHASANIDRHLRGAGVGVLFALEAFDVARAVHAVVDEHASFALPLRVTDVRFRTDIATPCIVLEYVATCRSLLGARWCVLAIKANRQPFEHKSLSKSKYAELSGRERRPYRPHPLLLYP